MKSCAYCQRTFRKTEHLLRHQRSHTGEKPFQCPKCGRRYARSDVLQRHLKLYHAQSNGVEEPQGDTHQASGEDGSLSFSETNVNANTVIDSPASSPVLPDHDQVRQQPLEQQRYSNTVTGAAHNPLQTPNSNAATLDNVSNLAQAGLPLTNIFDSYVEDNQIANGIFDLFYSDIGMLDYLDFPTTSRPQPSRTRGSQLSSIERADIIPLERFAEVERLWPNKATAVAAERFIADLWDEVVSYPGDNIYTDTSIPGISPASTMGDSEESSWAIDDEKRHELMLEFTQGHSGGFTANAYTEPQNIAFPPTRLLNLALNVSFRQPHSLLSFIHWPTFYAKLAPSSVVFSLCLLGLVLLDSKQIRAFTNLYLPKAMKKCHTELSQHLLEPHSGIRLITNLTCATILPMAWWIRPTDGPRDHLLAKMLYRQSISFAQASGLFLYHSDSAGPKGILERGILKDASHPPSDSAMWKTWARVESVKRLLTTMIIMDTWWAYTLNAPPLIHTHTMLVEVTCSTELFQSPSAKAWRRLVHDHALIVANTPITSSISPASEFLPITKDLSPVSVVGALCIIWIRVLEIHARTISLQAIHGGGIQPCLVPWNTYAADESGKMLPHMLTEYYTRNSSFFKHKNPNCVVLWHFLNLNLLANLQTFELAAGRNGAEPARAALQEIAAWSHTRYARRACLHAAGIYNAMTRRRISDGTMFHSEVALFMASLVLGLYIFMMQPAAEPSGEPTPPDHPGTASAVEKEPYELLSDVEWLDLGADWWEEPSTLSGSSPQTVAGSGISANIAALRFVRDGAVISFSGSACEGGYSAAKMVLLEFTNLLEEVGKWKAKSLCHIMRIMSDSLLDMDES
ncbi:hypothetical protein BX600DRAFT_552491 [Xylariales sp. PMI_506]|nr:hypothetical protein BX600DRAFT_552491 [Xylariales sp. PMI_506]